MDSLKVIVISGGSTYNIYETLRMNELSIVGTAMFHQYVSVLQTKRTSGTITMGNHFSAWFKLGMNLGS